jgi:2-oxoglutarate ferredoxin oxidoreductase subunit alpha
MDLNIRIAGEAGQGVQTTGYLLMGALAGLGLHVVSSQSYLSRIRGGLNWFDIRIGDHALFAGREKADILVAMTDVAYQILRGELTSNGIILCDGEDHEDAVAMPFAQIAKEVAQSDMMANSVAAGAVFAVLGYPLESLHEYLATQFQKKSQEIIDQNVTCANRGHELAEKCNRHLAAPHPDTAPEYLISGASAIGLAAATAGVKLAASYPMSPGTATFAYLAGVDEKYGIVVEQAEDEIAAINMICGATYAGIPALTTTSGGGFALMTEGLSLAGIMELPVCIVLAQRPGPATGLPTRTGQQDLQFALRGGHGEFARAIFAPGTVRQCYEVTRLALEIAHRFQTPAIILTDQFLQDLQQNIYPLPEAYQPIDRAIEANPSDDYQRYAVTESGVSPRAIPGGPAPVICDSDEHSASGHISEDLNSHLAQQDKRLRKHVGLLNQALPPERYGPAAAETLLVCWGSTYGACREAVDRLNASGRSTAMLHFAQVWPLRTEEVLRATETAQRYFCVEGNSTGLFADLLREQGVCRPATPLLRYDGLAFTAEYILEALENAQ